ncbi:MAG: anion permease [Candidatus Nanohaloarchaea archaeon]|nr:anion permease [Candidatus Nanohaloarchaea archaeon]
MEALFFGIGILVAVFVGVNIGGSSTGVAFGPATGSNIISKRKAAVLMAVFAMLGGVIVGPHVVETLGEGFVEPRYFTLTASIAVLLFTGIGILVGNILKVSVSTSETAVGAIVGMGAALGVLDWSLLGRVAMWWVFSAIVAFWISAVIGRYLYDRIVEVLQFESASRNTGAKVLVLGVGCYMAFSAGASNAANAVAPLVGSDVLGMTQGVVLAGLAIGAGAFLLGSRTMETIGEEVTSLTLEAALIVELIAATIITLLSQAGIPASLAISATMCVIGLGWGRATRRVPLSHEIGIEERTEEDRRRREEDELDLYDTAITRRVIAAWMLTPLIAGLLAFAVFRGAMVLGLL